MKYSRRDLLKCLAAGGAVVAGELWFPGAKKIFIPKAPYLNEAYPHGHLLRYATTQELMVDGRPALIRALADGVNRDVAVSIPHITGVLPINATGIVINAGDYASTIAVSQGAA